MLSFILAVIMAFTSTATRLPSAATSSQGNAAVTGGGTDGPGPQVPTCTPNLDCGGNGQH